MVQLIDEKDKTAVQWLEDNLISEPYTEEDFKHNANCWLNASYMEYNQSVKNYLKGCNHRIYKQKTNEMEIDRIVLNVIKKFEKRADDGLKKYGVTLERTDLSTLDWIEHAQDELMDGILYLERLKQDLK
jgi:hypothetical protein